VVIQKEDAQSLQSIDATASGRLDERYSVLDLLTQGTYLDDALVSLVRSIEAQSSSGMKGSILLLDAGGTRLRHGAAPSLPDAYNAAIDGVAIGPNAGSCGTAAHTRAPVVVSDIATDPLWTDYRDLALEHGLRACWSTPIFSAAGEVLGTFAMYYDEPRSPSDDDRQLIAFAARTAALLIERKRAEETRARLAAIVESSDDAIVSKDLNGIITSWNSGAERLFGYRADEAIGQPITIVIPPDRLDEEPEILRRIRHGERVDHFETVRRRKDGALRDISLTVSPIVDGRGTIVGASKIARDITERRSLERQREAFVGIAAHELRTPVTGIKGYTQLLARRLRRVGESSAVETLARLDAQVDRLTSLIDDLLDVTRIEGGSLSFRPGPFELNALLAEIIDVVQRTSARHRIVSELASPVTLVGDRERIGQVVTNLLTNAIAYSPQSDRVIVRTVLDVEDVVVAVQDFGIGIPKVDQPRVFDRFYRVNSESRAGHAGLGLGLYIAAEFVRRHGGTIWVESETGEGTTISFSLPLGTSTASGAGTAERSG
jgi:PAS domain S-box-containing protein